MNNEYKDNLLRYFTNNAKEESGENIPLYIDEEFKENNIINDIMEALGGVGIHTGGCLQSKVSDKFYIYGSYGTNNENGYIALCNENYEFEEVFTSYDTGTLLRPIVDLKEDSEGRLYGLDTIVDDFTPSTRRIILLNNIQNDYYVKLRNDYIIPSSYNLIAQEIEKVEDEAVYFITGNIMTAPGYFKLGLIQFTINVGSENEWLFASSNIISESNSLSPDFSISKEGNVNVMTLYYFLLNEDDSSSILYKGTFQEGTYTEIDVLDLDERGEYVQVINKNLVFYATWKKTTTQTVKIYKYTVLNNEEIYRYTIDDTINILYLRVRKYEDTILALLTYSVMATEQTPSREEYYLGIYADNVLQMEYLGQQVSISFGTGMILNYHNYNLYKAVVISRHYIYSISSVLNNVYDGESFDNKNSLLPYSSRILNTNGKTTFARNLYNKSINQNTTTSTLEIPSNYLNHVGDISREYLYSVNNNILVENNQNIDKNIYEKIFINFINTIYLENRNDPDNITYNLIGASRINDSATGTLDYEEATMTKVRINYEDLTNEIISPEITTLNNNDRQYEFSLQVSKEINNIEFISEDENTSYLIITPTLEVNKTYNIKQKVGIE